VEGGAGVERAAGISRHFRVSGSFPACAGFVLDQHQELLVAANALRAAAPSGGETMNMNLRMALVLLAICAGWAVSACFG
jgi:hypothetical protein